MKGSWSYRNTVSEGSFRRAKKVEGWGNCVVQMRKVVKYPHGVVGVGTVRRMMVIRRCRGWWIMVDGRMWMHW
jgi:hypothetical protein